MPYAAVLCGTFAALCVTTLPLNLSTFLRTQITQMQQINTD